MKHVVVYQVIHNHFKSGRVIHPLRKDEVGNVSVLKGIAVSVHTRRMYSAVLTSTSDVNFIGKHTHQTVSGWRMYHLADFVSFGKAFTIDEKGEVTEVCMNDMYEPGDVQAMDLLLGHFGECDKHLCSMKAELHKRGVHAFFYPPKAAHGAGWCDNGLFSELRRSIF